MNTGKLNLNLDYQRNDVLMIHQTSILSLAFSEDSEYLASGSEDGMIKIWSIKKGNCIRKISDAHGKGVSCLKFSKDSSQILSCSFDKKIKIHGLNSGNLLKEFLGHDSFVNEVSFIENDQKVISCSSDSTVKVFIISLIFCEIWDATTTECLKSFSPSTSNKQVTIHSVKYVNGSVLVCDSSKFISVFDLNGQLVKSFTHDKPVGSVFLSDHL
jgi:WD40 repeat-containing protein SMU1